MTHAAFLRLREPSAHDHEEGRVFVPVRVGGTVRRFLLDTGAAQAIVYDDTDLARSPRLGTISSIDALGTQASVPVVVLPPLTLGQLTLTGLHATVHQRPPLYLINHHSFAQALDSCLAQNPAQIADTVAGSFVRGLHGRERQAPVVRLQLDSLVFAGHALRYYAGPHHPGAFPSGRSAAGPRSRDLHAPPPPALHSLLKRCM